MKYLLLTTAISCAHYTVNIEPSAADAKALACYHEELTLMCVDFGHAVLHSLGDLDDKQANDLLTKARETVSAERLQQ